jgi:hypothetical protein
MMKGIKERQGGSIKPTRARINRGTKVGYLQIFLEFDLSVFQPSGTGGKADVLEQESPTMPHTFLQFVLDNLQSSRVGRKDELRSGKVQPCRTWH